MFSAISWTLGGLALIVGIVVLGALFLPSPFKVDDASVSDPTVVDLNAIDLPDPAKHYFESISDALPQTDTAVIWGRGRVRNGSIWMPIRFKAYIDNNNGPEMSRYTEVTWYNVSLLRSVDYYIDGEGALIGDGAAKLFDEGPMATQAEFSSIWAQMVTMPSMFLTSPNTSWGELDATSSEFTLPSLNDERDMLTFHFDEAGLVESISTSRYRVEDKVRMPWRVKFSNWKTFDQIGVPARHEFMWEDTGAYVIFDVEGIVYHINPSANMKRDLPPT